MHLTHAWGMTETSPLGSISREPGGVEGEDAWRYRVTQGRLAASVEARLVGPDGSVVPRDGDGGRRAGGARAVDHRVVLPGRRPGQVRRRLAAHRRRRQHHAGRLPHPDRPVQGRHQVRRRVDLLGRAGERADGAPGRGRGLGGRRARTRSGASGRWRPSWCARASRSAPTSCARSWPSGSRTGSCRSAGPSSTRCPRPSVGKFDKKVIRRRYADGALDVQTLSSK